MKYLLDTNAWADYHRTSRAHVVGTLLRVVVPPDDNYSEGVRFAHQALLQRVKVVTGPDGWSEMTMPDGQPVEIPLVPLPPLVAEAVASVNLDGDTHSHPASITCPCGKPKVIPLNGGMAKCGVCHWIRRPDGRWYSV